MNTEEIKSIPYNDFDQLPGNKLWLKSGGSYSLRHKYYIVTDNIHTYGRIYFAFDKALKTILETNNNIIVALGSTSGDFAIQTPEKKVIGYGEKKLFSTKVSLKLNNSFKALLDSRFFSSDYFWTDEFGIQLIKITYGAVIEFTFLKLANETPNLNVLILAGFMSLHNEGSNEALFSEGLV
ncbi:hypothetical protein ACFFGT_17285 [Mucilaginibacter angelicae]|uniref:Uncharacterized protein n=1 Tax=Mucilaginibacter angelicae TaxID=869718 RepID=A0ABV6L940_9SPHI